ncbi:hypothetical protein OGAPHI_004597 [Ogataea philodendri]|uniref:PIN domain-containing protein n=1 Tax=Ogataea philodendri TaxID=1378263 RepID=A0A9P8P2X2_9ASCO|nr:uncharacterized protein OGAPHI_004597 [Ogataea philodendri]KAH3664245.1 hypothetical protein OGAPHI_004597 [Ogataea philodendri]
MSYSDMMDVEERRDLPPGKLVLVFDTNFLLDQLSIADGLRGLPVAHQLVIPQQVVRELDGLKSSDSHVATAARKAIDWLYAFLHNNDEIVRVQRLHERTDRQATGDDAILDACLFFGTEAMVVLFSNDKNLCVKALAHGVLTVSWRPDMDVQMVRQRLVQEFARVNGDVMDLEPKETVHTSSTDTVYSQVHALVLEAIEYVLKHEFGDDFDMIGYDVNKSRSLRDCCYTLKQYTISTFGSYFRSGSINPLKLLKEKQKIDEYSSKPTTPEQLREFVEFWTIVLDGLYRNRDNEQRSALNTVTQAWRNVL